MSENKPVVLQLTDVYKSYYDHAEKRDRRILNDVDLKVRKGEFVTLLGPSGCGKSTLLRLILGSEKPSSGTVMIDGHAVSGPSRERGIVYQKYSLFPHLTVLENVTFGLEVEAFGLMSRLARRAALKKHRRQSEEKAKEMLARMGLGNDGNKYPRELSGGMRQRVAIAQAMIMEPKILLMDEPFGALDDNTRTDMQLFLLEVWERTKMTVFFVTHDLVEACFMGTRVLVLSQYYNTANASHEGSKIVTDRAIPGGHPKPTSFKNSAELSQMLETLRRSGLNPDYAKHIHDFDLTHADAYRSVSAEEWGTEQPYES